MPSGTSEIKWRIVPGADLSWHSWDHEFVVFNAASGSAHLLNIVEAEALRCMEDRDLDFSELTRSTAKALDLNEDTADLERYLRMLLIQYEEVGLIEPVTP